MSVIKRTQFGDPILRHIARQLTVREILAPNIQQLITNMRSTLIEKKLGIGLAAPQIGESLALAVIAVRPTPHRPEAEEFDRVLINPQITDHVGHKKQLWEGCISSGSNGAADLFAKVPRYSKIKVKYLDESGRQQHKEFAGLRAQVVQHEVDHLNGILFVDRVRDTTTYMTYKEYRARVTRGKNKLA